ncbi:MAG: four helix bundle protein [bacterium]|nr:four helix bundle protein [bacterium]MDT8366976.1 four helix bundle protein [bacterium]
MTKFVQDFSELKVYKNAIEAAADIYKTTKAFPPEERYSMVSQIRHSSSSVCSNIAEAWMKRLYRAAFVAKLSDSISEAAETIVWLEMAERCNYLHREKRVQLESNYRGIIGQLVKMTNQADQWLVKEEETFYQSNDKEFT